VEQQKGVGVAGWSGVLPDSGAATALFPSHLTSLSLPISQLACCRDGLQGIGGQFPTLASLPLFTCARIVPQPFSSRALPIFAPAASTDD
jgi:hypothetical protein